MHSPPSYLPQVLQGAGSCTHNNFSKAIAYQCSISLGLPQAKPSFLHNLGLLAQGAANPPPFPLISPSPRLQSQMSTKKWNPASLRFYLSPQRRLPCPCVPPRPRRTTEDCSPLAWGPCPSAFPVCTCPRLSRDPTAPLTLPTIPTYH